jgi:hypothetical protein
VSPGSEPERDDTGLPPVDVEIPDDARELDRDVLAYRRELRARRRQRRRTRWHRSLGRDGIVLPLLACCLILALITGTLLTVFTATSDQGLTGPPGSSGNSALATPHIVRSGLLSRGVILVDGDVPIALNQLRQTMLVLVPKNCDCSGTLDWLARVAMAADARAYMVYDQQTKVEVEHIYGQLDYQGQAVLAPAEDSHDVLTNPASFPAGVPASKLTAVLVARDRTVRYASGLSPNDVGSGLVQAITA